MLELAQYSQSFDVLMSILKITNNNPFTVFTQILSRLVVLYMVMPFVEEGHFCITLTAYAWAVTEVVRYTFYSLKLLEMGTPGSISNFVVGGLRYNLFIILYPLGVTGELWCFFKVW